MMKQGRHSHRPALWLLLAAAALPTTPLSAQDQPVTTPPAGTTVPPVDVPDPAPPQPVATDPAPQTPAPVATQPLPTVTTRPTPATEAAPPAARRTTARTTRTTTTRAAAPARAATPARQSAPVAAAAAAPAAAPTASTAQPAAQAAAPAPTATPAPLPVPEETSEGGPSILMWAIGAGLLLLLGFALFNMLRHRRPADEDHEVYAEPDLPVRDVHDEPMPTMAAPAAAGAPLHRETLSSPMGDVVDADEFAPAPADAVIPAEDVTVAAAALDERAAENAEESVATPEEVAVAEPDPADVEALAAGSAAPDGRPWLEFLMRPVRAGTSKDATVVEFELTVGNTGSAPARDVRISTFMFAAGSAAESEMERMLIDPPADAALAEVEIEPGEATRVEAAMALPRERPTGGSVLPVVVADARYRLPDGSEGRTRASFEVGIPAGEGLDPFPTDRTSGLLETVEARLHDEPERV